MNASTDELIRLAEGLGLRGVDGALYRIVLRPNAGVDFVDQTDCVRAELLRTADHRGWLLYAHSEFDSVQPEELPIVHAMKANGGQPVLVPMPLAIPPIALDLEIEKPAANPSAA
jgi:hypothetical protein